MAWSAISLNDVADIFNGKTPSKADQRATGHPVLKIRDVSSLGRFRDGFESFVDESYVAKHREKVLRLGDTLILNAAHNASHVASKTYFAEPAPIGALITGEWLIIRPRGDRVDPRYVNHWVNSTRTRAELRELVNGIHLYPKDVGRLRLELPPIEEQRRIANILDHTNALRVKRREALALLDDLSQSIFLDMFGGAESNWPTSSVGELADAARGGMRTGPFGSQLLHSEFVDSGIAVLGIDNAVHNEFRWGAERYITVTKYEQLQRYTVQPGDVLITIMGTCGRAAIVPDDVPTAINTKHLCCISVDRARCSPEYLHAYFLRHPDALQYLQRTAKGAIMSGLNMGIIKAMPIALAPIDQQARFVNRLNQINSTARTTRQSSVDFDDLFSALQQRAFAGEL